MMEAIDINLHPARFTPATSPVSSDDVESSRATGDFVQVTSPQDYPKYEEPRDLPGAYFPYIGWLYEQMDSAAGLNKPAQGSDSSKEVSGVARRVAIEQSLVSLSRMQAAVHSAWQRHGRVKLQLAMKHFNVAQLLRFVGVDGVAKQEWFTGNDFATVGNIQIATGTGTLMAPSERVSYVSQLKDVGFLDMDEALQLARPAFRKTLGTKDNPHEQRIERQISSWLEGPPEGWEEEVAAYEMAAMAYQQEAELASQTGAPLNPPPKEPWTPFAVEPMDADPVIAGIRKRQLARLMAKVEFSEQPEPWKDMARRAYMVANEAATPPQVMQGAGPIAPQEPPPMVA